MNSIYFSEKWNFHKSKREFAIFRDWPVKNLRDIEPAQKLRSSTALENYSENNDQAGGREHRLSRIRDGVSYGESKAHGAS